jgi:outer membrane protein insertion porin family
LSRKKRLAVVVLVLALAMGGLLLAGRFPQEPLRRMIEARLRQSIGAESSLGSVHIVPGRLQIELHDLVLAGPNFRLEAPRAYAVATLDFVLGRSLALRELDAESPRLTLRPADETKAKQPLLTKALTIDRLELRGGTIVYEAGPETGTVELRGVDARGSIGQGTLELAVHDGTWRRPHPLELRSAHATLRVSSALDVTIDVLEAGTARSQLHGSGRLGILGMMEPDLQLDAQVDLAEARSFRAEPRLAGVVSVKGRVKQTDHAVLDAFVEGEHLNLAGWPVEHTSGNVKYGVTGAGESQADLQAKLLGGRAGAQVSLSGNRADGRLRFEGIEVERLRRQGVAIGFPDQGRLSGTLTGGGDVRKTIALRAQFEGTGTGSGLALRARGEAQGGVEVASRRVDLDWTVDLKADPLRKAGAGALRLGAVAVTARGRAAGPLPPAIESTFTGEATMVTEAGAERVPLSGRLTYRNELLSASAGLTGLGGGADVALALRGSFVQHLELQVRSIDLARLVQGAQGRLDAAATLQGPLDALSGNGRADLAGLTWKQMDVGDANLRFDAARGRANVAFAAPALNVSGEGIATEQRFRGTIRLAEAQIEKVRPLLPTERPLSGTVSGTVDVDVPWSAPRNTVAVAHLERADVQSGTLEAHAQKPFTLALRGQRVEVQGLEVQGPGMDLAAEGSLSLAPQGALDLRLRGLVDLARVPAPEGWTLQGEANGDVRLTGTRARPRADGTVAMSQGLIQRPGTPPVQIEQGEIVLAGDTATARNLKVTAQDSSLEFTGSIPLTAVLGEDAARRLGLGPAAPSNLTASLNVSLANLPLPAPWSATGRLIGDALFTGTLGRPRATGDLTLADVILLRNGVPVASVPAGVVRLAGDAVELPDLEAEIAEGRIVLSGRVPLAAVLGETRAERFQLASGEASLRVAWQDIEAAALEETLRPDRPALLHGLLSGSAVVEGQFTNWRALRGRLETPELTLRAENEQLALAPLQLVLENGRVTTNGLTIRVPGSTFRVTGEADLVRDTLQAHAEGRLALRALSAFLEDMALGGRAEVDVDVTGSVKAPRPTGTLTLRDATLRVRDLPLAFTDVKGVIVVEPGAVRIQEATALLGGGTIGLTGGATLQGLRVQEVKVDAAAREVALRYPVGGRYSKPLWQDLKARVNADLTLSGKPGNFLLAGTVNAERALYDADIFLEESILPPQVPPEPLQPSPFRRSVALNIAVDLDNPLMVRNNLVELQADGTLSIRGDLETIAPFGRMDLLEGGKVILQGREFSISSGTLVFKGTTDPEIHITATTVVNQTTGDIEVTVSASGQLESPQLTLTSVPSYSEKELASLIVTGRTDVTLDSSTAVLGEAAATLLAGRFTRQISRQLMALGFDQVDIQPELLAREGDPRARFVFGKQVSQNLRLIYALGLNDPEARYYQALLRFRPGREITLKARRDDSDTYTYSAGQRLRLGRGGRPAFVEEPKTKLTAVEFPDESAVPEDQLRQWIGVKPGKSVTFWDLVDESDKVQKELVELGYIEALVDPHLHEQTAHFHVRTGPKYTWRVEGMETPPDLTKDIRQAFHEEEALERGRDRLLEELHKRGYLRAVVETRAERPNQARSEAAEPIDAAERARRRGERQARREARRQAREAQAANPNATSAPDPRPATRAAGGSRVLVYEVNPGPLLTLADVSFPGASVFSAGALVKAVGGAPQLLSNPVEAQTKIKQLYRQEQYLVTRVQAPQVAEDGGRLRVVTAIEEGPQAVLAEVKVSGSTLPTEDVLPLLRIEAGERYDALRAAETVLRLRDRYLELGYPSVRVATTVIPNGPDLSLVFQVSEGLRQTVGDVVIKGLQRTRESLVRKQVTLKKGEWLDPRKLSNLERRILDLGFFSRAVVTASETSPATITIDVEEAPRWLVAYDLGYNVDEKGSVTLDGQRDNLFGRGWSIGGRYRQGRGLDEQRASFHVPSFFRTADLTFSVFRRRDDRITAGDVRTIEFGLPPLGGRLREQGFQVQQALHFDRPWEVLYGYRYRRVRTAPPGVEEFTVQDVGGVDVAVVRDTRETALASIRKGSFSSVSLEVAPKALGSDADFVKGFTQFSITFPLQRSVVLASGFRLGLGKARGGRLVSFERFTAGGANSVRGFATDSLGELDDLRQPGGDAVVILNEELRYEHGLTGLGAALFWDAGNVFPSLDEFKLKLRHSVGVGLRYDSPIGLLRIDFAIPLNRRIRDGFEEEKYQLWFGLGQAF